MSRYNWSKVPKNVDWIATDYSGRVYGYISNKPEPIELIRCWSSEWKLSIGLGFINGDDVCEDWRKSLEKRPQNEIPKKYPAYKLKMYWPAICKKCNWRGLTEDCPDPDEFNNEVVCPKCKSIVEKDSNVIAIGKNHE